MFKSALFTLLALAVSCGAYSDEWKYSESTDVMDGSSSSIAMSYPATPLRTLPFPYQDTQVAMTLRCGSILNAMLVFVGPLQIDGRFTDIGTSAKIRVKWDEYLETREIVVPRSADSAAVFTMIEELPRLMSESSNVIVELPLYGIGHVPFKISLKGSSEPISKVVSNCKKSGG